MGRVLMVQGTTSGAGKSMLATALCRLYARRGLRVAPFKCQNMSLNSFATPGGGEIGRSQALQAEAAGLQPHVDMNPILLKPAGRRGCQVVLLGRPIGHYTELDDEMRFGRLFPAAMAALDRLRAQYQVIIAEGAGSPSEINLRGRDIANMPTARHAEAAVLLVADIDRCGVFASLMGTVELLNPWERDLVVGLVINRMRGPADVLRPGLDELVRRTGKPVLGVIPYLDDLALDDEDALNLDIGGGTFGDGVLRIAVIRLPHIANFTDFQVLEREPGVSLRYAVRPADLSGAHAVIVPGSKETLTDLAWLRAHGLAEAVIEHHRAGGIVLGICGGLQMMGTRLGAEQPTAGSEPPDVPGLGLLPVETDFQEDKRTVQVRGESLAGHLDVVAGLPLVGYEIHTGRSRRTGGRAFAMVAAAGEAPREDGAVSDDGRAAGTYLHGLFDSEAYRSAWLAAARRTAGLEAQGGRAAADALPWPHQTGRGTPTNPIIRGAAIDRLADAVEAALDMNAVDRLLGFR